MSIKFIVDNREKALQEVFDENKTEYESRQLDLGDILIEYTREYDDKKDDDKKDKKDTSKITHTLVFERKTFLDLNASMADTRYHEQKSRYLKLPSNSAFYILENNDRNFSTLSKKKYTGTYVNTMIRDNIKVFITNSVKETYELLIKIGETLDKFGVNFLSSSSSSSSSSYSDTQIKKKKAVGIDVFKNQLACFPGISEGKAGSIAEIYPSMKSLIKAIEDDTFKVKGIGKILLDKIKSNLFL